ncbi:MAG: peptidylprolyl isomerase [Alphaproteobacteria bacterium]|nr:peptidylprolyl isomerase [Alphaproteobacteria bacterium]
MSPARPLAALLPLALPLALASLAACGPSSEVQAELDGLKEKVGELETQSARLEKENGELVANNRKLEQEIQRLRLREVYLRLDLSEGDTLHAHLDTTQGTIDCELWPQYAPQTVLNFVELAEGTREWTDPRTGRKVTRKLYDGTIFHRVIPGFMIQGGDPLGNGTGGPGYRFADETDSGLTFDKPGLLAMANSGPDTNGSQFFITDRSTPNHLDGKHTIFGACEDADVVQAIAETDKGVRDKPVTDQVLERVRIERRPG